MSGEGAPAATDVDGRGRRIALVVSRWHAELTDALFASAWEAARRCGVKGDDIEVVRVSGAFEIPVVAQALARSRRVDGVVCLGAVVRGGTPHFDHVCRAVTDGCARVALDTGVPVGFGVLTCDTVAQARERLDKGAEAVLAVLDTAKVLDGVAGRSG